ncbi:NUDIX domain-containing protein [Colletotrichum costaricense]|uniref:NUDIX domain-containing protein n=1 Tax=Colletotrichum costaricense TaxID=1209916 RepID=A0AAJ0E650_9PEZI|nr:NUDIX domain-containing protein [Colletotrichum costaricense]KAK1539160.1 NUDIX domain-containing protein [Colletotrichum costaricense]
MSPLEDSFGHTPKVHLLPDKPEGFTGIQSHEPGSLDITSPQRIVDGCDDSSADCKRIFEYNEEGPYKQPSLHDVEQFPSWTMIIRTSPLVSGVSPIPISVSGPQCENGIEQTAPSPGAVGKHENPMTHLDRLQLDSDGSATAETFQYQSAHEPPTCAQSRVPFKAEDNQFFYSPGQLNKMLNPKSLTAFYALGGFRGIEKGLKTDLRFGLSDKDVNIQSPVGVHEASGKAKSNLGQGYTNSDDLQCCRRVFGETRRLPPEEKLPLKFMRMVPSDKALIPVTIIAAITFGIAPYLLQPFAASTGGTLTFEWGKHVAIMAAVLIVMAIGALECQFREWSRKRNDSEIKVIRSGKHTLIPIYDILVGDVLTLEPYDLVPVDGIFIGGYNVICGESWATGKSDFVKKIPGKILGNHGEDTGMAYLDPFIISGSRVLQGTCTVLVTAVGQRSNIRRIMMSMRDDESADTRALARFMFMASQLSNSLCITLALDTNLLPEISRRINCCVVSLLFVPVLNLVRFCIDMFQSETIFDTDAVKPSFFLLHTNTNCDTSFRLEHSLATNFPEGAITDSDTLSILADSMRHGPASMGTEWTGIGSKPTNSSPARQHRSRSSFKPRLAVGIFLACYGLPLTAAAVRVVRGLRIASGFTSTVSGVTVIPLRTSEGFPVWSWELTYGVWATAFSVYLWQQTRRIPRNANHRRQLVPLDFDFNNLYKLFLPNDSRPHGFMVQSTVERLPWTVDFHVDHDKRVVQLLNTTTKDDEDPGKTRTAAFQRVVDAAIASEYFPSLNKIHSEHFRIIGANHFVSIERFPAPLFGISSRGAHMTAYVRTSEGMKIWVPRRSAHLFTFPNLLDTTVAGGVKAEDSPFDCIIAEATEEASLPADFVKENARAVGAVTYCSLNKQRGTFFPTVLYVYDLELPESIEPQPGDDEVSGFELMTIDQVKDAMLGEQFKPNCVLVMLDFFIRHNIMNSENNDEYLEIVTRMRRHLPVPTSPERRD